ncbi:site-2 protease family protein [Winogradskyella sediminis]|uniref:site-2 protease family protein n=1 Tax=Winogradskyella sediminis TaxID=1382466 RepID=UPI000E2284D7|nr:site-2 protease family protein [Winogradskyella sediminis]REG84099.1 peptidase M50-like protein [Winogradskyella sediminis]
MVIKILEILSIIILLFVVLGVHELGHLIAGLVQGFRFELFVVGPLGIKREDNKIKLFLNKNIAHYGGIASTLPKEDNPENSKKLAIICLAGPISSVILAIILGIIYYAFEFQSSHIILIGALASIGIFLATTIPNKSGTFFTDRKRYQRLTSNGKERDVELAVLRIIGNYGKDNSYINVNPNDIETMISDEHYKYFGLFTKLTYQFETNGHFELETENEFEKASKVMPKSLVKATKMQLDKVTK